MTDLIRRDDADAAIVKCKGNGATRQACRDAIAALPAVMVCDCRVRDLIEFLEENPDNIHFLPVDQLQILRDRLAALEPVAAPRRYMGQIMAECDCSRQGECEAAQKCLAGAALDDLARLGQEYDAAPEPAAITADEFDKRNRGYMPAKGAAE